MYNRVDGTGDDVISIDIDSDSVSVFDKDIPKLIKALQAAYDMKVANNGN